jgi:drug/metabolite transporter (DMT)-like permease
LVLLALAVTWGSSFILIKRALFAWDGSPIFTAFETGALRITIAGIFLAPAAFRQMKLLRTPRVKYFLLVGLCGNAIPAFLFATAQTGIPSALAGMINSLTPLFALLLGILVFRNSVKPLQVVGIVVGLIAAILLLFSSGSMQGQAIDWRYMVPAIAAAFLYGVSLNVIKEYLQEQPALAITSLALLLVLPIGLAVLAFTDVPHKLMHLSGAWHSLGAVSLLAILGTAVALVLFNRLVQETGALFAASVTYLIPVVAIGWGLADGEGLNVWQGVAAGAMVVAIALINRK